jgi:hypothetical protein
MFYIGFLVNLFLDQDNGGSFRNVSWLSKGIQDCMSQNIELFMNTAEGTWKSCIAYPVADMAAYGSFCDKLPLPSFQSRLSVIWAQREHDWCVIYNL